MARKDRSTKPTGPDTAQIRDKIERLRALRLSDEAARQAAGTWGEMSVGEILHRPSGEVFIYSWKGRALPELEKLPAKRPSVKDADQHNRLVAWMTGHKMVGFELTLLGWTLSEAEVLRMREALIAERQAKGRVVVNLEPAAA